MADTLTLMDEALALADQELELLATGNVEQASDASHKRGLLLAEAWSQREPEQLDALRDKLIRLRSLQGRLTSEARQLHDTVRKDLARAKQEGARLAGYGKTVKPKPLFSSFVSKQG